MIYQYSILIQWSEEDNCYVVSLPEFGPYAHTHGDTYEEALQSAQEVLQMLIEDTPKESLPQPQTFQVA